MLSHANDPLQDLPPPPYVRVQESRRRKVGNPHIAVDALRRGAGKNPAVPAVGVPVVAMHLSEDEFCFRLKPREEALQTLHVKLPRGPNDRKGRLLRASPFTLRLRQV
jgi:hypothetical protein